MDSKIVEDDVVQMIMSYGRCAEDAFLASKIDTMISTGLLGDIGSVTGEKIINFIKNYEIN
jgi:UDP-N-acetylglucosamine transferase subunit ALG13